MRSRESTRVVRKGFSLRAFVSVVVALLVPSLVRAHLEPIKESEPNNTPATATPLTTTTTCFAALGAISPGGDLDYFSFTAPPGSRLWALVDTSASTASRDSILTLFAPNGTTQIEQDDNGGVGTNCDMTIETRESSAIAGRILTAGGTYFLRVQASDPSWLITLYKLLVVVVPSAATAEAEPNDTAATANPIVTSDSPIGVRRGSIRVGDVDYYSVVATTVGSVLHISVDTDPKAGTKFGVDLIQSNGAILQSVNSDNPGLPTARALSFCFILNNAGTYFVRVRGLPPSRSPTAGAYTLLVAACGVHMHAMEMPAVAPSVVPSPAVTRASPPRPR
jgi:hypothetical protein